MPREVYTLQYEASMQVHEVFRFLLCRRESSMLNLLFHLMGITFPVSVVRSSDKWECGS